MLTKCKLIAVMSMYIGAKTVVRTVYGNSKGFEVKVIAETEEELIKRLNE